MPIRRRQLTRSLSSALGIPPAAGELKEFLSILDPDDDGYATYEPFVALCALKYHARDQSSDAHAQELDEAFALFSGGGKGGSETIGFADLKRIATLLNAEVDDQTIKDMILEGNGGAGVSQGVTKEEFDVLMRRAGVWR
jgi:Ca2+-binding EF-hand superfamily protein